MSDMNRRLSERSASRSASSGQLRAFPDGAPAPSTQQPPALGSSEEVTRQLNRLRSAERGAQSAEELATKSADGNVTANQPSPETAD